MKNSNIPDEEMNFDLNIEDILQTTSSASSEDTPSEEVEDSSNFLDDIKSTVDENMVEKDDDNEDDNNLPASSENESVEYSNDVYSAALDFLKENNLLSIPEDVGDINEEVWSQIIENNKIAQRDSLLNELRMNAGDDKIVELFDYVWNGGSWFGYEEMKNTIQSEINIESLDLNNDEDQRYLIESYLSDGLDPNNPAHVRRLQNLPNEVNNYFDRLEAEDLAKEAKDYFVSKIENQKLLIQQQQEEHRQNELAQQQALQEQQQEWVNNFKTSLDNRNWSKSKKDAVVQQFDLVQLNDGREMEMWKYKFDAIWEKPELTQVFMDFLSDLDPYTLEFKRNGVPTNKQVTSTIQNLINTKNQTKSKSQYQSSREDNTLTDTIDPRALI